MIFGTEKQIFTFDHSAFSVIPTSCTIHHSHDDFPRIEMCGVIDQRFALGEKKTPLSQYSIIELMVEVQQRIQSKENIKEKRS